MFNPYGARPIGSKQFERHLIEMMRTGIEKQEEVRANIPEIPVVYRVDPTERHTRIDPVDEAYKRLALAILCSAIEDYIYEYECRIRLEDNGNFPKAFVHECRCMTIENEYFRIDDERSAILDGILRNIIHNEEDTKLQYRLDRMKRARKRIGNLYT